MYYSFDSSAAASLQNALESASTNLVNTASAKWDTDVTSSDIVDTAFENMTAQELQALIQLAQVHLGLKGN